MKKFRQLKKAGANLKLLLIRPRYLLLWWRTWHTLPVISWIQAVSCFRKGDYRSAALCYEKGLKHHPQHPAAQCAKLDYAYCLYRLQELKQSVQVLHQVVFPPSTSTRGPSQAFLLLAKIQLMLGEQSAACLTLKKASELFVDDAEVFNALMHTALERRTFGRGAIFTQADLWGIRCRLELFRDKLSEEGKIPEKEKSSLETAIAAYDIHCSDVESGEELLTQVFTSKNIPFEAYLLRAQLLLEKGSFLLATIQLQQAMQVDAYDPRPPMLLANHYLLPGELFEPVFAVQLATLACTHSQWNNPECLKLLIEAYRASEDYQNATLFEKFYKQLTHHRGISNEEVTPLQNLFPGTRPQKSTIVQ